MAQVYKKINIDVNSKITDIVTAIQKDASSRYLDVVLWDSATLIDLTGHEVRIYGKKADGTEFYNNGEITNATGGRCQFELTSQALAVANDLEVQIVVFKDNTEILSTQPFTIHVVKSLLSDSSIESSNEYGALVVLYQNLYEAYDLMTEMVQKIGNAGDIAQGLNLNTMFEVWEWLITYMQENSTAGVVDIVNAINSKIGSSTTGDTVLGIVSKGTIKKIQKGTFSMSGSDTSKDITLSGFTNVNKMIALVNGGATQTGSSNVSKSTVPYVYNLTLSALTIKPNASINESMYGSYFVIEFN